MRKLVRFFLFVSASLILACAPAAAATSSEKNTTAPDPNSNQILATFIRQGTKVYYLGNRSGMDGWFLVKDNQIQVIYIPPDSQAVITGAMYDNLGNNITTEQIRTLYQGNKEVREFLTGSNRPAVPSTTPGQSPLSTGNPNLGLPNLTSSSQSELSAGEKLVKALQEASGVNMGAAAAPTMYMIADPYCPHCQATWKALRQDVFAGKLQVRLVPIDAVDPDSARAAAQFLRSADPLNAWDKYIAGDHSQLAGTPDASTLAAIRSNHALIEAWHIQMTPYIAYRAKDGQIKIVQGEPEQAASIVNDIAP